LELAGEMSQLSVYGLGSVGRPTLSILWVSPTDHPVKRKKQMRPSSDSWKKLLVSRPWSSWETLMTPKSAGRITDFL